jgi:protein-L-isoaspartate(D-aspartate) O-methyltransferase
LSLRAQIKLSELGFTNIHFTIGSGFKGYKEASPFDVVLLTAAPSSIPAVLVEQLKERGRLIGPVGRFSQKLIAGEKIRGHLKERRITSVAFVPMVDR